MTLTAVIALYAAIVATVSATLSLRKWLVTGPRLSLSAMARGRTFGGLQEDDKEYLVLNVTNRGDLPTTLSTMAVFRFRSLAHRLLRKPFWAALVANPIVLGGPGTPYLIAPGTTWMGAIVYDETLLSFAKSGKLFVAIHGSHTRKPAIVRVRWRETAEEKTARLAAKSAQN